MSCKNIHQELVDMEEVVYPFCNKEIGNRSKKIEQCCSQPDIVNNNTIVCKKCGTVYGYKPIVEYVEFHENK